jgi:hypothetical protein
METSCNSSLAASGGLCYVMGSMRKLCDLRQQRKICVKLENMSEIPPEQKFPKKLLRES